MTRKLFTLLLLCLAISGFSGESIRELLKKAGDQTKYPNDNQLIVFDSTLVDVQETGLTYVWNHTLIKILNSKGAQEMNVVKFGFDPLSAFVDIKKVCIYRNDGNVDELDLTNIMDYPAPARAIYWGAREKMIEIGRLEPGDAIEVIMFRKGFTYALLGDGDDDKYIPPMKGQFYDIVEFYNTNPIKLKVYRVAIPRSKLLQFEFYNGEAQTSLWLEKEKIVYTFSKSDINPFKNEPRSVALSDVAPKLLLSTSPDWYAKSTWFFMVNEDFGSFESTPDIKLKVEQILNGAKNEMDSVSRLTHWCADEIRYSGISMGKGEGFTLHKGSMTFTDRCGVCKDKAGMLITMLRAAGFRAYPAMTMAGSRIDYIPADQFNHCVTIAKLRDGKYHLLDPTWVPFVRELWSSAEQQQQYLMGVPEGADLATTPVSDPDNHYIRIHGKSELAADGTLSGKLTISAEGQSDAAVRGLFKYSNRTTWLQNVERELLKLWPQVKILDIEFSDPSDYLSDPISISIEFIIPQFALLSDNTLVFIPLTAAQVFKSFQGHLSFDPSLKERKYPFRDRCSRLVELSETIKMPVFSKVVRIPESISKSGKAASLNGGYKLSNDTLSFEFKARLEKRIYDSQDWPEYKAVIEAQNNFAEKSVIIHL